jgi:hypothetical protein
MTTPGTLQATIDQILGSQTYTSAKNFVATSATSAYSSVSSTASSYTGGDTGGFFLKTLFYFLLYSFILLLILIFVHFTVRPVFSFVPGGKGFLQVPSGSDDKVYWNDKKQPIPDSIEARTPIDNPLKVGITDTLTAYDWINNFSFSVDIYIRKLQESNPNKRIILYKTYRYGNVGSGTPVVDSPFKDTPIASNESLVTYMKPKCSMLVYLTDANDLIVTFFSSVGGTSTEFSCRPIKNIPLNEPFRLSVVVEENMFTVYLNGKQTFQKFVSKTGITLPSYTSNSGQPERFYPPPSWAINPRTVYVQNLHLWPRPISYAEVVSAQPALAKKEDFDLPQDVLSGKCA